MNLYDEYLLNQSLFNLVNKYDLSDIEFEFAYFKYEGKTMCLYKSKKYIQGVQYLGDCFTEKELDKLYKIIQFTPKYYRLKNLKTIIYDITKYFNN